MSEPKFQVGQSVAVMAFDPTVTNPTVVIPKTTVRAMRYFESGTIYEWEGGYEWTPPCSMWMYEVESEPRFYFDEKRLRPIDPDNEYKDTEQEKELQVN